MATEKRLIDLDIAIERARASDAIVGSNIWETSEVVEFLEDCPIEDAVEVVHGRWTEAEDGDGAVCSVCGEDFCNVYHEVARFIYCPNCGAKMDGERKDND